MIQSLYTAASGMSVQQKKIDTIANNIANLNTVGYKQSRVDFKDAIYQTMINPDAASQGNNLQQGHGALISSIKKDFTETGIEETDNALDFSIIGDGFFAVDSENEILYTRDGSFRVSVEGQEKYLVADTGEYVLDNNLNRIVITDNESNLMPGVFDFPNQSGLYATGNNKYRVSESSGGAELIQNPEVKQYYLETSNVDITSQLTQMIRAQRAYQAAAKAISTADEMEGIANNIRN